MKREIQTVMLLITVLAASSSCGNGAVPILPAGCQADLASSQAGNASDKLRDSGQAVGELAKMGVPLEKDVLGRVRWIEAVKGELNDPAMRLLPGLPMLEWLEIGGGNLTPAGMAHLKDCRAIRRLYVHDLKLGTDSFPWLADFRRLEALSLKNTGITGKGLEHLHVPGALKVLNLSDNEINDEDLGRIARLTGLEVLSLQNTRVTGAGLARLAGMAKLNELNLTNCRIVDADLQHFTSMPNLRIVFAAGTEIGDEAIRSLGEKQSMLSIFK